MNPRNLYSVTNGSYHPSIEALNPYNSGEIHNGILYPDPYSPTTSDGDATPYLKPSTPAGTNRVDLTSLYKRQPKYNNTTRYDPSTSLHQSTNTLPNSSGRVFIMRRNGIEYQRHYPHSAAAAAAAAGIGMDERTVFGDHNNNHTWPIEKQQHMQPKYPPPTPVIPNLRRITMPTPRYIPTSCLKKPSFISMPMVTRPEPKHSKQVLYKTTTLSSNNNKEGQRVGTGFTPRASRLNLIESRRSKRTIPDNNAFMVSRITKHITPIFPPPPPTPAAPMVPMNKPNLANCKKTMVFSDGDELKSMVSDNVNQMGDFDLVASGDEGAGGAATGIRVDRYAKMFLQKNNTVKPSKTKSQHRQQNAGVDDAPRITHRRVRRKRSLLVQQPKKPSSSKTPAKSDVNTLQQQRHCSSAIEKPCPSLDLSQTTKSMEAEQEVYGVLRSSLLTPVSYSASSHMTPEDVSKRLTRRYDELYHSMEQNSNVSNVCAATNDSQFSSDAEEGLMDLIGGGGGDESDSCGSVIDSMLSSVNGADVTEDDRSKLKEMFKEMARPNTAKVDASKKQEKGEEKKNEEVARDSVKITTIKGYQHTTNSGLGFVDPRVRSPEEAMNEARLKIPSVARLELQRSKSIVIGLIDQEMNKSLSGTVQMDAADAIAYVQNSTESAKEMAVTEAVTDTLLQLPPNAQSQTNSDSTMNSAEVPSLEHQRGKLTKLVKLMRRNRLRHIQSELKQLEELDETIDI